MERVWSRRGSLWAGCIDSGTCDCHDTAMPDDERYSLTELADLAGVTPRTVRYYLAQGLLPAVGQTGPGSKYTAAHLARLRLIRGLQAEHLPLAEIRRRLETIGDAEIRDLIGASEPAPPPDTALEYLRTVLGGSLAARAVARPNVRPIMPAPQMPGVRPVFATPAPLASMSVSEAPVEPHEPSPEPAPADARVRPSDRSQWERIVLVPDVELHIRRPLPRAQSKQVDRLVTIARELLEEDRP
jgi:DNA-binding transcriptional MerR regulator